MTLHYELTGVTSFRTLASLHISWVTFKSNQQDTIRGVFMMWVFKYHIHETQHILSKISQTDFFLTLIFCFPFYVHNSCVFSFLSLIFPKPFHLLVTVLSTPSFSVCFCLGTVSPFSLPPKQNYSQFCSLSFTFSFILYPQGGTIPPPTSHRSVLPQLLTSGDLSGSAGGSGTPHLWPFPTQINSKQKEGSWEEQQATTHHPSHPTCSSHTSWGHLHLQGLPNMRGNLPPSSMWEIEDPLCKRLFYNGPIFFHGQSNLHGSVELVGPVENISTLKIFSRKEVLD